jgi:FkbM family methyltransferase
MSAMNKALKSLRMHFELFGAEGVIRRALIGVPGANCEYKAPIPDGPNKLLLRLGTTDVAAFEHVFFRKEYGFSLQKEPSVIVDAGANAGMSAVYFSTRYPHAKVIAIEPEPTTFDVLRKNAELFPQIVPVKAALWNREGAVQIEDAGGGHWAMRVTEADPSSAKFIPTVTIPMLLKQHAIDYIDVLKIDIEGAEYEIFEDASSWIDQVGMICVELHDRFRPGCAQLFEAATAAFPVRWRRGELHCVARAGLVSTQ